MRYVLVFLFLTLSALRAEESTPLAPVVVWDLARLEAVRERIRKGDAELAPAMERLRVEADKSIQGPPVTVTDKVANALSPSGDPHDFVSFSTYHWPDETDPKAPWVWKDGKFNTEMIDRYDLPRLKRMTELVTDGGLAWWFTGERRFADAAMQQLRMWFITPATRMNPHLEYGQFIPNKDGNRGHAYGIIDTRTLVPMLSAVALLERGNLIPDEDRRALRDWFRAYLHWLITSRLGQDEGKATNNHGIYYDQQVFAYAAYVGDEARMHDVVDRFAQQRIAAQIAADGSMPRELARADAATYAMFNLTGLVQLMAMVSHEGTELRGWTSPEGNSLRAATVWFIPYVEGKAWTWSGTFKPQKLTEAFHVAASLTGDADVLPLARRLATDPTARRNLLFPLPVGQP